METIERVKKRNLVDFSAAVTLMIILRHGPLKIEELVIKLEETSKDIEKIAGYVIPFWITLRCGKTDHDSFADFIKNWEESRHVNIDAEGRISILPNGILAIMARYQPMESGIF